MQDSYDEKVKISVNISKRLLIALDNNRKETSQDRSTWVASAIMEKIARNKLNN